MTKLYEVRLLHPDVTAAPRAPGEPVRLAATPFGGTGQTIDHPGVIAGASPQGFLWIRLEQSPGENDLRLENFESISFAGSNGVSCPICALRPLEGGGPISHLGSIAPLAVGDVGAELDQVLSNLAWLDEFSLGAGVHAITGGSSGTAVKPFTAVSDGKVRSQEKYRFVESKKDYEAEVETSAAAKYNIGGVSISASASYLTKVEYSETIITLVASFEQEEITYAEANVYELTEAAAALSKDPAKFRSAFGDYFVAGVRNGAKFVATYVCTLKSEKSMQEFKASFGVQAPDVFSAEGSLRLKEAAAKSHAELKVSLDMYGYADGDKAPSGPWTPETIIEALSWFKANISRAPVKAKLKHYSTVDPTFPRQVDVAPDIFLDLRRLYLGVWDLRAQNASCPANYVDEFEADFRDIDLGVQAYQSVLPTNEEKRAEFHRKIAALTHRFDQVFARQKFYLRIVNLVEKEPQNQNWISESGRTTWLYGLATSPDPAVIINSDYQHYSHLWEHAVLYHTFDFTPGPDVLIVGWEVISVWDADTNGQWRKLKTEPILLTDRSSIQVGSWYLRGFNWAVRIHYVAAKDYRF